MNAETETPTERYIVIDEEGYFAFDGRRVDDETLGRTLIENLRLDSKDQLITTYKDVPSFVEAFDAPLLGRHVRLLDAKTGEIDLAYGAKAAFSFSELSLDEWDRFHGVTDKKVPFVFTRQGQVEFFDLLDSFDDDSITVKGVQYEVPAWSIVQETMPPLNHESPILHDVLPQLKLTRSRVLNLSSGYGHDAAYFAKAGHFVTAVESDPKMMAAAQEKYAKQENLKFVRADLSNLPDNWSGEFDLIFANCTDGSTPPVKLWRRLLQPAGNLLGIFAANEWEVRERLKGGFQSLYWTRWRRSVEGRKGRELVVYARKKD